MFLAVEWLVENVNPKFVLKTDDDAYVDTAHMVTALKELCQQPNCEDERCVCASTIIIKFRGRGRIKGSGRVRLRAECRVSPHRAQSPVPRPTPCGLLFSSRRKSDGVAGLGERVELQMSAVSCASWSL